jgi:hypothetical protein
MSGMLSNNESFDIEEKDEEKTIYTPYTLQVKAHT